MASVTKTGPGVAPGDAPHGGAGTGPVLTHIDLDTHRHKQTRTGMCSTHTQGYDVDTHRDMTWLSLMCTRTWKGVKYPVKNFPGRFDKSRHKQNKTNNSMFFALVTCHMF